MNTTYMEMCAIIARINKAKATLMTMEQEYNFHWFNTDYNVVEVPGKGYAIEYIEENGQKVRVYGANMLGCELLAKKFEHVVDNFMQDLSVRDELNNLTDLEKSVLGILPHRHEIFESIMEKLSAAGKVYVARNGGGYV